MFFADPVAAFVNIGRGMKPGGRLALVVWNDPAHNEWFTAASQALALGRSLPIPPPGAPGPYGMADREHTHGVLDAAGFGQVAFDDVAVPFRSAPTPTRRSSSPAGSGSCGGARRASTTTSAPRRSTLSAR